MREHQITVPTDPRIAEGYSTARALGRTILAVLSLVLIGALLGVVLFATGARAAGSDSPTPYTVDRTGITLPAGQTFPDNGHVNIRWDGGAAGLHFEGKCVTRTDAECAGARHEAAQFIGASFIPWSAFGVPTDACITWVQISTFDEHFGEGGQPAVCLTEEDPCPETPEPTPTDPSSPQPSPEPSESVPSGPSEPKPTETPAPDPDTEPTAPPTSSPAATELPIPAVTPAPTEYRSEVSAVDERAATAPPRELAATGASAAGGALLAVGLVVLGAYLFTFERRNRR